jgi:ferritin-like metal-binding protein YciE
MAQQINSLQSLINEELKDMYDMEKQLTKALPKMAKNASSGELRSALEEHLQVTEKQVQRLEQVFDLLGQPAKGKTCKGMKGLIDEGKEVMDEEGEEPFSDIALIAAAQRVEHYEMAAYGTARTLAEKLGETEAVDLLQETLEEEKEADQKLTEITQTLLREHGAETAARGEEEEGAIDITRRRTGTTGQMSRRGASTPRRRAS